MKPPETRYARSGDVRIAYQVIGNGPIDREARRHSRKHFVFEHVWVATPEYRFHECGNEVTFTDCWIGLVNRIRPLA